MRSHRWAYRPGVACHPTERRGPLPGPLDTVWAAVRAGADAVGYFREHGDSVIADVALQEQMSGRRGAIHNPSSEIPGTAFRSASRMLGTGK
jgi:hypothetical protein